MIRLLRSELFKQRTTLTSAQLLLWMAALVLFVVLLHVFTLPVSTLDSRDGQLRVFGWGTGVGALFAALLGAMSITNEIRHGTIRSTLLATPGRTRVIAAKVGASALTGLIIGLLAEALAGGSGSAELAARGIRVAANAGDFAHMLAGGAAAAALWAAIGTGVGAIVRNQVGAIIGLCVWLLLVETILISNIPAIGKFAPAASAGAIAGAIQTQSATILLAPVLGGLLLAAYAVAAIAVGSIATTRRDVS
jgi:ABC-2 type transport system permease protein